MIEIRDNALSITSSVHDDARTSIGFQRTLRIPDDGHTYPLPAGLGHFPLAHVADHTDRVPEAWARHGGIMLPMWRTEAMWLDFHSDYPWAIKVAAGKRCAITGKPFTMDLHDDPQDYLVVPSQPWLDGFAVEADQIRQFVAMTLGAGYTVEEQLSGKAEWGGIQIVAYPMYADRWEKILEQRRREHARRNEAGELGLAMRLSVSALEMPMAAAAAPDMGMAAGGLMRQKVHADKYGIDAWDTTARERLFVHLCDAQVWRVVTGSDAPTVPPTAAEYEAQGIPWFDLPEAGSGVGGGDGLSQVKPISEIATGKGEPGYPSNDTVVPGNVVPLSPTAVIDGSW